MGETLTPPPANPLVCPLAGTFINAEGRLSTPLRLGACFASSSNPDLFSLERASHPVSSSDPHLMDFLAKAAVTSELAAAAPLALTTLFLERQSVHGEELSCVVHWLRPSQSLHPLFCPVGTYAYPIGLLE